MELSRCGSTRKIITGAAYLPHKARRNETMIYVTETRGRLNIDGLFCVGWMDVLSSDKKKGEAFRRLKWPFYNRWQHFQSYIRRLPSQWSDLRPLAQHSPSEGLQQGGKLHPGCSHGRDPPHTLPRRVLCLTSTIVLKCTDRFLVRHLLVLSLLLVSLFLVSSYFLTPCHLLPHSSLSLFCL